MPSPAVAAAPFPWSDPALPERHLLALPVGVDADAVEALALSRFASATWEDATDGATHTRFGRRSRPAAAARALRLSRHSRLVGPFALGADGANRLGLPASSATAFLVESPHERGELPYPGGDRDGIKRAFAAGMPVRDEERVVRWLVAAARRVGGAVRIAGSGVVLLPDYQASLDLTVYSDTWLEPLAALAVTQRVTPGAQLAIAGVPWAGPPDGIGTSDAPDAARTSDLPAGERRNLHAEADAYDVAALSAPAELDGYGVQTDLGMDGLLVLEVGGEEVLPPVLDGVPWAAGGAVVYRVRWLPTDPEELELEHPSFAHRVARSRVQPLLSALARQIQHAAGGEVLDEAEFLVDPADL